MRVAPSPAPPFSPLRVPASLLSASLFASVWPLPVAHFRHVVSVNSNVVFVREPFVSHRLLHLRADSFQRWDSIDHVHHKMKPIEIVHHYHVERSRCSSFLFVPANVNVPVVCSPV